ncbi:uncharacterized protein LOC144443049 [Glandiceps talaboti]
MEDINPRSIQYPPSTPKTNRAQNNKSKAKQKLKAKPIKFMNVNCQSVRAKLHKFQVLLEIVTGTESWLNSSISTGEIFPTNYQVFRKDRGNGDTHGGVFIAVKDNLMASEVIKNLDIALRNIPANASVWLSGDFSLPNIDWEALRFNAGGSYAGPSKTMIDIALDHNLYQQVKETTRSNNILDLCFTNCPPHVISTDVIPGISDHEVVTATISLKPILVRPIKHKFYLYKKANYTEIQTMLQHFDSKLSSQYTEATDVDIIVSEFNQLIQNAMNQHIPSQMSSSRWKLPWINRSIRRDVCIKKRLYKKARKHATLSTWDAFKKHRRNTDRKTRKAKQEYVHDVIGGSLQTNNTKPFWNFIKSSRQEVFGVSTLTASSGTTVSSARDKANVLNDRFVSVFTDEDLLSFPTLPISTVPTIPTIHINSAGVEKPLKDINPSKASGSDAIPARILKEYAPSIAPILSKIFQKSLNSGHLPQAWLNANVTPLYKKCDRTKP